MAATIKKSKTTKAKPLRPATYATDWPAYERGQLARGAHIVLLMSELQGAPAPAVLEGKRPAHRPCVYSDETIYAMCFLKLVLRQPFRVVEGMVRAWRDQVQGAWPVPDHTTLSRRMRRLEVELPELPAGERHVFVVDSTGLKLSGQGEWNARQHGVSGRRQWVKAHLVVEANSGLIVEATRTGGDASDEKQFERLLEAQPLRGNTVSADGAYHKHSCFTHVHSRGGKLLAPPPCNARRWKEEAPGIRPRNELLQDFKTLGRQLWGYLSGYSRRALVECANSRFKRLTGSRLAARHDAAQWVELRMRASWLNVCQRIWQVAGGTPAIAVPA